MIAIVTAIEREAGPVRRLLRIMPWGASGTLRVSGVGRQAATGCVADLATQAERPDLLLSLGFAGATRREAAVGDLVLSSGLRALGQEGAFESDPTLLGVAEEACRKAGLRYRVADSLTVPSFVRSAGEKARLADTTGAWAINMEDYWLAAGAAEADIPFLAVRAIVDRADQSLPPFVAPLASWSGVGQVTRTALALAWRPWHLPGVLALARQTGRAQRSLVAFAEAFLPRAIELRRSELVTTIRGEG